jgi:hypothetical protein
MASVFKRIIFWNYGRSSWQYDVLCALILAFIFLTPKGWFASELAASAGHPKTLAANTLLLAWPAGQPAIPPDTAEIERRARQAAGRNDVQVRAVRAVRDEAGMVVAYQVDIE